MISEEFIFNYLKKQYSNYLMILTKLHACSDPRYVDDLLKSGDNKKTIEEVERLTDYLREHYRVLKPLTFENSQEQEKEEISEYMSFSFWFTKMLKKQLEEEYYSFLCAECPYSSSVDFYINFKSIFCNQKKRGVPLDEIEPGSCHAFGEDGINYLFDLVNNKKGQSDFERLVDHHALLNADTK